MYCDTAQGETGKHLKSKDSKHLISSEINETRTGVAISQRLKRVRGWRVEISTFSEAMRLASLPSSDTVGA